MSGQQPPQGPQIPPIPGDPRYNGPIAPPAQNYAGPLIPPIQNPNPQIPPISGGSTVTPSQASTQAPNSSSYYSESGQSRN